MIYILILLLVSLDVMDHVQLLVLKGRVKSLEEGLWVLREHLSSSDGTVRISPASNEETRD